MKNKIGAMDIVLLLLSAVLLIGVLTVFAPCGPKEDGSWMTCHWAGRAVAGAAAALTVIAALRPIARNARLGLDLAMLPISLLTLLLPGKLIGLCMMAEMRCRSVMTPAVTVLSLLIAAAAAIDAFLQKKKG